MDACGARNLNLRMLLSRASASSGEIEGVSKAAAPWQTRGPNFDRLPRYETMLAYHGFMTPACVLSYRLYGTPVLLLCHARAVHRLELSKTGRKQPACRKRVSLSCRSCLRSKALRLCAGKDTGVEGSTTNPWRVAAWFAVASTVWGSRCNLS